MGLSWKEVSQEILNHTFNGHLAPNRYLISKSNAYDPAYCKQDKSIGSARKYFGHPAMECDGEVNGEQLRFHRFMFNGANPVTMEGSMAVFEGPHGVAKSPFRNCRPRGRGWMVLLQGKQEYRMYFETHEHISNISFTGDIDDFEDDDYVTIRHDLVERIDYAGMIGRNQTSGGMVPMGEKLNITEWPTGNKDEILQIKPYDYMIDRVETPFSVYYSFNGQGVPKGQVATKKGQDIDALTNGRRFTVTPNFYKCFFKDCIVPEPAPPVEEPPMQKCPLVHCPNSNYDEYKELHIPNTVHAVIDREAMSRANNHFKWSSLFLSGTLEVKADDLQDGDTLTIEVDHIILNTVAKSKDELSRRKRRDVRTYDNGGLVIGTAEKPIPCGAKVIVKIGGDIHAQSFGALPDSIPIGAKAIGGLGSIRMHGCAPQNTWTQVKTSVNAGDSSFTVTGDITGWKVGDRLFVATSDFKKEHTEEFNIAGISGNTITIDGSFKYKHFGVDDTTQSLLDRDFNQGAEVGLLSRNIVLDGRDGSYEDDFGARIVLTKTEEVIGHHTYVRSGVGQFDGVEFQGFGQKGADRYSDYRCQILFYDLAGDENEDEGREQSYVKNCAFNRGYHTAVATMKNSDGIIIENNVVLGTVNHGLMSDSQNTVFKNNLVASCDHILLYKDYFSTTQNANFNVDVLPAGIWHGTEATTTLEGNHVVGISGSCYFGVGEQCDESEACSTTSNQGTFKDNVGHACWNGYYLYRRGYWCTRIANFNFYKTHHFGVLVYTGIKTAVVDSVIVADSRVGFASVLTGPTAIGHAMGDSSFTVKNSAVIGMTDTFDCATDDFDYHGRPYTSKMHPPLEPEDQVAFMIPEFPDVMTGFPQSGQWDTDKDVVLEGRSCVLNTAISNYANKCPGVKSIVVSLKEGVLDHAFQMTFDEGNTCTNCDPSTMSQIYRPKDESVNSADCGDMHCDGLKRVMIVDKSGCAILCGYPHAT